MSPRPTHCVVDSSGVAVSQHISEERAEAAARRRTARNPHGDRYQVRPISPAVPPAAALGPRPAGRPRRSADVADVRLEVRVSPSELAVYRERARSEGLSLSEWVRARLG